MGYQYIRHRCSNAAWARGVSLRAAASTTDQCVVTKAGASGTSSRWLLSLAAIALTLAKSAQTLQEINWTAASGAGFSLTRLSHLADDQADCREQDRGSYDFEMLPGLSFPLCLSLSLTSANGPGSILSGFDLSRNVSYSVPITIVISLISSPGLVSRPKSMMLSPSWRIFTTF